MMDARMTTMREMHEKMSGAGTPRERQARMAAHMKPMQDGVGPGAMGGKGGMAGMAGMGPTGAASAPMDMATRQQPMDKRMAIMQSMMH